MFLFLREMKIEGDRKPSSATTQHTVNYYLINSIMHYFCYRVLSNITERRSKRKTKKYAALSKTKLENDKYSLSSTNI